ncbi:formyltransferase family protein [Actinokineospora sp. UTMC 2448]|uniref:formyltransferase family protein n=1 Tax=Actinokineospora sp. UTMC 2448 TaxID=2268449 RepID=UPI0021640EB9|nr:formyltransferase family protein [Actinokineospora sp. UTMC 2448]UVS81022.1 Methionyl-tRNA formyltransferase [Actinokineospora sp. UTMC 2448]
MIKESVLFIGDTSRWSALAASYLDDVFEKVDTLLWDHGDPKPDIIDTWSGDRVFCFKADLVLSPALLNRVRGSAINFHPSPPRYRGVGGYHFAIKDGCTEFGVTCHHIVRKIDAGRIIQVRRFPITPNETGAGLTERAGAYLLLLFYEMVDLIRTGQPLPESDEEWGERLYTRKMLAELLRTGRVEALDATLTTA